MRMTCYCPLDYKGNAKLTEIKHFAHSPRAREWDSQDVSSYLPISKFTTSLY